MSSSKNNKQNSQYNLDIFLTLFSALFRFFGSAVRKQDRPGDLLPKWTEDELSETDSLEATLPASEGASDGFVPVRIHSRIDRAIRALRHLARA